MCRVLAEVRGSELSPSGSDGFVTNIFKELKNGGIERFNTVQFHCSFNSFVFIEWHLLTGHNLASFDPLILSTQNQFTATNYSLLQRYICIRGSRGRARRTPP